MSLWWPRTDDLQDWLRDYGYVARDWGLSSSAMMRPVATFEGSDVYPSLYEKVAAVLDSIERSHPFIDGNKRVGFLVVGLILEGNGIHVSRVSDDNWYSLILEAASGHTEVSELAVRLQSLFDDD